MSLTDYFQNLIKRVEASDEIQNDGKDRNGFYKPTRTLVLRHLNLLRDLHAKPNAKEMVRGAWKQVVEILPPDWLILNDAEKADLRRMLE